jgi:hypothetical protein
MKNDMTLSARKSVSAWNIVLAGICLILLISVAGCGRKPNPYRPGSAKTGFPQADIVYVTEGLGFVNADGSGAAVLPFWIRSLDVTSSWHTPLITGDGKMIFTAYGGAPGYLSKILAVQAGQEAVDCKWFGIVQIAADGSHILVDTGEAIEVYLPEDCGTGNPPEKVYSGVSGVLSPDGQHVASLRFKVAGGSELNIVLHDIPSEEESLAGEGNFPAWSRDGKRLAYTGPDGIYILSGSPPAEPRRLVALEAPRSEPSRPLYQENRYSHYYPPVPSWSPDGQWLVYHAFNSTPVDPAAGVWAQYYSIFKVNVETGETIKVLDGGYSPYWRWSPEQP